MGEFISGLGKGLTGFGIDLFLSAIPQGQSELTVIRNIVSTRRADGLILARTAEVDKRVEYLLDKRFPFVTHGRVLGHEGVFPWVDTDGAVAFAEAFDLLYALGHRRFALMTIKEPMTFRLHRTEGLQRAIQARGDASVSLQVVTAPHHNPNLRREHIQRMLAQPNRPTAILALFDGLALSVMAEAEAAGLCAPQDLSIIGFDNIASAAHARPGLTTFDSDTVEGGRMLAQMLVERLTAGVDAPARSTLIPPKMVLRGSHGAASP